MPRLAIRSTFPPDWAGIQRRRRRGDQPERVPQFGPVDKGENLPAALGKVRVGIRFERIRPEDASLRAMYVEEAWTPAMRLPPSRRKRE